MSKILDGPWELTTDGYGVWSEEAFTVVLWTAHNAKTRTPQAREVARLACAAPDLYRELAHLVRLLETLEFSAHNQWGEECPVCGGIVLGGHEDDCELAARLNGARTALARADGGGEGDGGGAADAD